MPTLEWIGKEKVINHDKEVPFRILEPQYTYDSEGKHEGVATSENMIIHGDNLLALKALLPKYRGKIKCIYIDPPYNTGNEGWIYNDNVNDPQIKKWLGEVVGKEGEDFSRHDKWLCMMYPRLKLLHQLLSDDGVIFISIGDDEISNLLSITEEIFGKIVAIFVWKSRSKPTNAGQARFRPQKVTEYVIMFTKDENKNFNVGVKEDDYSYPNEDEYGKYRTSTILTSNLGSYQRETMRFEVAGYTPPADKRWKAGYNTIKGLFDNHRLLFTSEGYPMEKIYDYDNNNVITPLYTNIDPQITGTAESGKTQLNKVIGSGHGFDTVKPLGLLEYLIKISTEPGDIVLDSFAGTGTTAHAVLNIEKQLDSRNFIIVELGDYAENITAQRLKNVISGYETQNDKKIAIYTKELKVSNLAQAPLMLEEAEKVRDMAKASGKYYKVSNPIIQDSHLQVIATERSSGIIEGTGGSFTFYELGPELFDENGNLNEAVSTYRIREYIWFTETQRPLASHDDDNKAFLGVANDCAYYFHYDKDATTTLDHEFMATIKTKADSYVIYADVCSLDDDFLSKHHITFKKIPRDIARI